MPPNCVNASVRGMAVAVASSTLVPGPTTLAFCPTENLCCSSVMTKSNAFPAFLAALSKAVVPIWMPSPSLPPLVTSTTGTSR